MLGYVLFKVDLKTDLFEKIVVMHGKDKGMSTIVMQGKRMKNILVKSYDKGKCVNIRVVEMLSCICFMYKSH